MKKIKCTVKHVFFVFCLLFLVKMFMYVKLAELVHTSALLLTVWIIKWKKYKIRKNIITCKVLLMTTENGWFTVGYFSQALFLIQLQLQLRCKAKKILIAISPHMSQPAPDPTIKEKILSCYNRRTHFILKHYSAGGGIRHFKGVIAPKLTGLLMV